MSADLSKYSCTLSYPHSRAMCIMIPVGAFPLFGIQKLQLQIFRHGGQIHSEQAKALRRSSPYRFWRQGPQNWPLVPLQFLLWQTVLVSIVFCLHWWHVDPRTLSYILSVLLSTVLTRWLAIPGFPSSSTGMSSSTVTRLLLQKRKNLLAITHLCDWVYVNNDSPKDNSQSNSVINTPTLLSFTKVTPQSYA